jgi:hypothetical protein
MNPAVVVTLVVSVAGVIFASITAPLILAHRTERMHREDMLADYQRQDKVAEAAAAAVKAAQVSAAAIRQHIAVTVVKLDNANVKLDVIHGLVNSTLSAALQSELDALTTSLAMMREVITLKQRGGQEPAAEAVIAIQDTEAKIAELKATLADRLQQAESLAGDAAAAVAARTAETQAAADAATARQMP